MLLLRRAISRWVSRVDEFYLHTVLATLTNTGLTGSSSELDRVPSGDEKIAHTPPGDRHNAYLDPSIMEADYEGKPTQEELETLRRVPGNLPVVAYLICIVEFCERASFYGVQPLIANYVNKSRKLS